MEFFPSKDLMLSCPLVIVILVWAHVLRKLCVCMCVCVCLCVCVNVYGVATAQPQVSPSGMRSFRQTRSLTSLCLTNKVRMAG